MRDTDDLREVIRVEFARLDLDGTGLTGRLEEYAVAAAGGTDPRSSAAVGLATVAGAHEIVEAPAPTPTVGELPARRLVAEALRWRRTPGSPA